MVFVSVGSSGGTGKGEIRGVRVCVEGGSLRNESEAGNRVE
jgi:hypothetical protein